MNSYGLRGYKDPIILSKDLIFVYKLLLKDDEGRKSKVLEILYSGNHKLLY